MKIKLTRASRAVIERARRNHQCPEDYEGPCWGPTQDEIDQALAELKEEMKL